MLDTIQDNKSDDLSKFKTDDGQHFTGLVDDPTLEIVERFDDSNLEQQPNQNFKYMKMTASLMLKASIDEKTYPDLNTYTNICGSTTNQSIGSCYMHAITNQAKWLVWMHTGIKYSPSNTTIDQKYAQGVSGGLYSAITRLWDSSVDDDDFIKAFRSVASKCGITKLNAASGTKYQGFGEVGKENAIKMLNAYGPLWYAHDCGLYSSNGYHAIIFIGYDKKYAYFQNSWGKPAGHPKVEWDHFTSYQHGYNTYFQTYGNVSGVNVWKDL